MKLIKILELLSVGWAKSIGLILGIACLIESWNIDSIAYMLSGIAFIVLQQLVNMWLDSGTKQEANNG